MSDTTSQLRPLLRIAIDKFPTTVKHRAKNSMDGFLKAFDLFELDREMASFRAITAQEEAASALFMALKWQKYPGADRLNVWNHRHKAALWPVLDAVRIAISRTPFREMKFVLDATEPRVQIGLPLSKLVADLPAELLEAHVSPVNPLDMFNGVGSEPYLFAAEIAEVVAHHGQDSTARHISTLANSRNLLLYASDSGVPASKATMETLQARRDASETALYIAIAILQTPKLQAYALQVLEAFLGVVDKADELAMPYPEPVEADIVFTSDGAESV